MLRICGLKRLLSIGAVQSSSEQYLRQIELLSNKGDWTAVLSLVDVCENHLKTKLSNRANNRVESLIEQNQIHRVETTVDQLRNDVTIKSSGTQVPAVKMQVHVNGTVESL